MSDKVKDSVEKKQDFIFDVLPVEIQVELTKYLSAENCRQMRLVSHGWNDGIKKIVPFDYKKCTLTDPTAAHVLPFSHPIRSIEVHDLSNKRKIVTAITPFGVVNSAKELVLGENIHPLVVKKLLKTGKEVNCLELNPLDPRVGEELLKFPMQFDNVTKFGVGLKLNTDLAVLKEEELLVRKLSLWRKFPHLIHFSASFNLPQIRILMSTEETLLVHSIYISLHRFLHSHRETLSCITWNFCSLAVLGFHSFFRNIPEYSRVKGKMAEVELKRIDIRMNDMEGEDFWDLSETLLRNQFNLSHLTFTGTAIWGSNSLSTNFLSLPIAIVNDVVEQNQFSLTDLQIENRVFSFFSIANCRQLRSLVLKGASIISTTPLNNLDAPKAIEELYLDFKFVFPPDIVNLLGWIPKLWKLKTLSLKLKMQWTTTEGFPSIDDFHVLFQAPMLTKLTLHYDVPTGFKLFQVKNKGDALWNVLKKFAGVSFTTKHSIQEKMYSLEFTLDRKVFKEVRSFC